MEMEREREREESKKYNYLSHISSPTQDVDKAQKGVIAQNLVIDLIKEQVNPPSAIYAGLSRKDNQA